MGDSEATRSDARLASGKLCADNCHSELDSYGRLLHGFGPVGNYRTVDEAGRPIDPSATLTANSPLGPMTVSGPVAFANALVSSKVFAGCAVQRLFEAAVDVSVPARDTCQVDDLRRRVQSVGRDDRVAAPPDRAVGLRARPRGRNPVISYKMARRSFLRALRRVRGAHAAPLAIDGGARAGPARTQRLLILHHCQGSPLDRWRPAASATTTTSRCPRTAHPSRRCNRRWS